jgi:hypothetical protein
MTPVRTGYLLFLAAIVCFFFASPRVAPSSGEMGRAAERNAVPPLQKLPRLPVRFEKNLGQHDASARFVARSGPTTLVLRDDGARIVVRSPGRDGELSHPVSISLSVDGGKTVSPTASMPLVTKVHDFHGSDPSRWRTEIPTFGRITYPSVREGVDLVYHGEQGVLEFDFVVAPGASVASVAMKVSGSGDLSLTDRGELSIPTAEGVLLQPPPVAYQDEPNGERNTIRSRYRLLGGDKVGFEVSSYDVSKPLVVDPVLASASYIGSAGTDLVAAVSRDSADNTLIAGTTTSVDLATLGTYAGACASCPSASDAFVTKLDATGTEVLFTTYLGGSGEDGAHALTVGADNTVYVAGNTTSSDFPTVSPLVGRQGVASDAFVARLSANGNALVYSTYLGGLGDDDATAIAVTASGIYVAGTSLSPLLAGVDYVDTPPSPTPPLKPNADAFVLKLASNGSAFDYGVFLGGSNIESAGSSLAVDSTGRAYITGTTASTDFPIVPAAPGATCAGAATTDAFIARLDATGSYVDFATCLGGSSDDQGHGITLDNVGNIYVVGHTSSADFPSVGSARAYSGGHDGFVAKFDAATGSLTYATVLGGAANDRILSVAVDGRATAWLTGITESSDFPTARALESSMHSASDAFVARLDPTSDTLLFSSFFGGTSGNDVATGISVGGSSIHVAGVTTSSDLPTSGAAQKAYRGSMDGFVAKFKVSPLLVVPQALALPVGYTQQFSATGGSGGGYVYALVTNASGATLSSSGLYTSGLTPETTDVIRVTDDTGLTATATILVGATPPPLSITPTSATLAPRGVRAFAASGGIAPITFGFASNASGAAISASGSYKAGAKGSVTDILRATDALGTSVLAHVQVGPSLEISPTSPAIPPRANVAFSATGGAGSGFTWSLTRSDSGGIIDAVTGIYVAGPNGNTTDTVRVVDELGNEAAVSISIGGGLAISAKSLSISPRGTIQFSAGGGREPLTWALGKASSGATLDPKTGTYQAGTTGNTIDIVVVSDVLGNSARATIEVGPSLTIAPSSVTLAAGATQLFSAAGGSGAGYRFAMGERASGATVSTEGLYIAGATAGTDTVVLKDSLGNEAVASITVLAASSRENDAGLVRDASTPEAGSFVDPGLTLGGGAAAGCTCRTTPQNTNDLSPAVAGLAFLMAVALRKRMAMPLLPRKVREDIRA